MSGDCSFPTCESAAEATKVTTEEHKRVRFLHFPGGWGDFMGHDQSFKVFDFLLVYLQNGYALYHEESLISPSFILTVTLMKRFVLRKM